MLSIELLLFSAIILHVQCDEWGSEPEPPRSSEDQEELCDTIPPPSTPGPEVTGCYAGVAFKRKTGWWCMRTLASGDTPRPYTIENALRVCKLVSNMTLSSIDSDEEWNFLIKHVQDPRFHYSSHVTAMWVAMEKGSNGEYYWSDGSADPKLKYDQPTIMYPNGVPAWMIDKKATSPPFGHFALLPRNGEYGGLEAVNTALCGAPGKKFT